MITDFDTRGDSVRSLYKRLVNESDSSAGSDGDWLITLSDLLSLLLIFFIMFVVLTKDINGLEKQRPAVFQNPVLPYEELQRETAFVGEWIKDDITSQIRSLDMGDDVSVLADDKEIIITMKEKVTFRPAETDILDRSGPVLKNIAEIIKKHPSFLIEIEGHTDNIPIQTSIYPSNWELSVARATSVLKYFIHNHGVDPSRFSVKGSADQKPVAPNDTPEDRARNRRVEIRLKESA